MTYSDLEKKLSNVPERYFSLVSAFFDLILALPNDSATNKEKRNSLFLDSQKVRTNIPHRTIPIVPYSSDSFVNKKTLRILGAFLNGDSRLLRLRSAQAPAGMTDYEFVAAFTSSIFFSTEPSSMAFMALSNPSLMLAAFLLM
jgi:hypothetical protein